MFLYIVNIESRKYNLIMISFSRLMIVHFMLFIFTSIACLPVAYFMGSNISYGNWTNDFQTINNIVIIFVLVERSVK